jgi:hypothetical protein
MLRILAIVLISMLLWAFPYGLLVGALARFLGRVALRQCRTWYWQIMPDGQVNGSLALSSAR